MWLEVLSADEKARAERFTQEKDQLHYQLGRGALRHCLARFLPYAATEITFRYNAQGKPYLDSHPVYFNVSHAKDQLLIAVAKVPVGVDVEWVRPRLEGEKIAKRFFHPAEYVELQALPSQQRQEGFYALWCAKEAFVKALGSGIAYGLDRFQIANAAVNPGLVWTADKHVFIKEWVIRPWCVEVGYTGAIAVNHSDPEWLMLESPGISAAGL